MREFHFENPNSPVAQFPPETIAAIIDLYNSGATIYEVRRKYPQLPSGPFYRILPYTKTEEKCKKCGGALCMKLKSNGYTKAETWLCPECGHDSTSKCSCAECEAERLAIEELKERNFHAFWPKHLAEKYRQKHNLEDLNIFDEIWLYILASHYYNPDRDYLAFPEARIVHRRYKVGGLPPEILDKVNFYIKRKIIIPSANNRHHIVSFDSKTHEVKTFQPYIREDGWDLNIYEDERRISLKEFMDGFESRQFSTQEKMAVWKHIYSSEISQYLDYCTEKYSRVEVGGLGRQFIAEMFIEHFSLARAFALVYSAAGTTLRYMLSYRADNRKVNTFFCNKIARYVGRFKDDRTVKEFNRPAVLELGSFNEFALQSILNIRKDYFYMTPRQLLDAVDIDTEQSK